MFVNMQTCIIFVFIHKMMDLRKFKTNMKVITSHNSKVGAIRGVLNHKCVVCDCDLFVFCVCKHGGGDHNSKVGAMREVLNHKCVDETFFGAMSSTLRHHCGLMLVW